MGGKREEFLARLRETFRVEAGEHLEAITAGLLALERGEPGERPAIVERVFREAHSLKGAARSVSLAEVEALCVELEGLFAALKRGELEPSTGLLDAVRPALAVLAILCGSPAAPASAKTREQEQRALAALQRLVRGGSAGQAEAPAAVVSTPAAVPEPSVAAVAGGPVGPDTVRVSTRKLGAILLEAEELVGARLAAEAHAAELRALAMELAGWNRRRVREATRLRRGGADAGRAAELLESELLYTRSLENSLRRLAGIARQDAPALSAGVDRLLEGVRQVLLLPCSYLLGGLPMVLRDLAREQGKEAELRVAGEDIEIDRRVLDELKDPLIHLLRNSVDHGIEQPDARGARGKPARGVVTVTVRPVEGSRVELTVADDGCGIDVAKARQAAVRLGLVEADQAARLAEAEVVELVFHSGLSTSPIITDLSGRGLGLTIVREKVERLGGSVAVRSDSGLGTTFRLVVPSSLATFRGVFVEAAGRRFVIPTAGVVRAGRVTPEEIKTIGNRPTVALGGHAVALARLRDVLELSGPDGRESDAARPLVLVRASGREVAFVVDEVLGEQEVMVKSLGRQLVRVRNVGGACIAGSGAVVPILNVVDLVESAAAAGAPQPTAAGAESAPERRSRLLLAEDSITARALVKGILEGAGYEVVAAVDGLDALTRLKSEPFDLLVSDVDMPRMNGFELTAKIRADRKLAELPVVLVTALGSQRDREYGIEVGANAYIVKTDFDQGNLLEIIRRLL
ncbi:MAG: response regulator [Thermoleophilaceae bacterium]|nr:response regulator [Thermoleophilaceae bacterium]